jgi:hypothetical protein
MQMRKNHQVAFAALAFLSASASGSPVQPLAHADIHVRSLQERDIPIVAEVIPLNARSAAGKRPRILAGIVIADTLPSRYRRPRRFKPETPEWTDS